MSENALEKPIIKIPPLKSYINSHENFMKFYETCFEKSSAALTAQYSSLVQQFLIEIAFSFTSQKINIVLEFQIQLFMVDMLARQVKNFIICMWFLRF